MRERINQLSLAPVSISLLQFPCASINDDVRTSHLLLHRYLPDYPYYGWATYDDDITGDGGTKAICQSMMEATSLTDWGQMPPSFDFLLGSHIHLGSITSFEDSNDGTRNPPQIVIGNSGTQFVAPSEPPDDIFGLEVKQTEVMYEYGYLVAIRKKRGGKSGKSHALFRDATDKSDGSWGLEFKVCSCNVANSARSDFSIHDLFSAQDEVGRNLVTCELDLKYVDCINLGFDAWFEEDLN